MVKHIVMWRVAGADKQATVDRIALLIAELTTSIPQLRHAQVGNNFNTGENAYDVVLISEFDDRDALGTYQRHPNHQAVAAEIALLTTDRVVVDYEY